MHGPGRNHLRGIFGICGIGDQVVGIVQTGSIVKPVVDDDTIQGLTAAKINLLATAAASDGARERL